MVCAKRIIVSETKKQKKKDLYNRCRLTATCVLIQEDLTLRRVTNSFSHVTVLIEENFPEINMYC